MNPFLALAFAGAAVLVFLRGRSDAGQGEQWGSVGGWVPAFEFVDYAPAEALAAVEDPAYDTMPDQLPTIAEAAAVTVAGALQSIPQALGLGPAPVAPGVEAANIRAALDTLAYAEGTAGPNGYRTLFGGNLFDDMSDHPRQFFSFTNSRGQTLRTSAAGRYQFLSRTWDALRKKLDLPDFGPASQDAAALELIRERGALDDVKAGRLGEFVRKCAPVWASLPGAGYAQPERKYSSLVATFTAAGGNLET